MHWLRVSRGVLLATAAVALLGACSDRTSILVRVSSTTFDAPGEIDALEFSIRGETTGTVVDESYVLSSTWPHTLSIRPGPTEFTAVTMTVNGLRGRTVVASAVVPRTAFVRGSEIVVDVVLGDAPADAGVPDSGMRDAGPTDAGPPDAGNPDAGCASDGACDDGIACTMDTCELFSCVHTPDDALCATGSTCDLATGCPARSCTAAAECDDRRFCTGTEACDGATMTCTPGTSPCDDGDACTDDACDETGDTCTHTTRDADGDTFGDGACPAVGGVPATDCDDANATVFPGAPETCDGLDNDCTGGCDSTSTCCRGTSEGCTTTCGSTGSRTCSVACGWGLCSPPAETCNGMDDDCNGACDDGVGCCAGSTSSCTTTCGSTGSRTCAGDCTFGVCNPPVEGCNGADDDCDMQIDEGFDCGIGMTRACTTSCGSTGLQACGAACGWGACMPPVEACNGVDDNCDGTTDEGCGACSACPGTTTVSGAGGRYDVNLSAASHAGSCGGSGNEGTLTFTITSTSDVLIATHGAAFDTVVYVRSCTCAGSEVACNDNADGLTSSALHLTDLAAGTYHVFVDSNVAMSRTVPVDVYISAPGTASDRCGDATFIPPGTTTLTGNTCGFANDYDVNLVAGAANCEFGGSGNGEDRVYYFYLPTSRSVTISGCNAATVYDSTLYVRSVCSDNSLTAQLACNEDGCSGARSCDRAYRSSKTMTLGPGLFYLFVDGYFGTGSTCPCGSYGFTLTGI